MQGTVLITGGSSFIGRNFIKALVNEGYTVKALVRSEKSAATVKHNGATAMIGDLLDPTRLNDILAGVDIVVHAAGETNLRANPNVLFDANVNATRNLMDAIDKSAVQRTLYITSDTVFADGFDHLDIPADALYPTAPAGKYSETKIEAEQIVKRHHSAKHEVIVVRSRCVWGRDDTTALPRLINIALSGRFAWIDDGHYTTSTTHIANLCHGLLLALQKGRGGESYHITDPEPSEYRAFVTQLLETQNIHVPTRSLPRYLAEMIVKRGEFLQNVTHGVIPPMMSWQEYATVGVSITLDISKAQNELGYAAVISQEEGMRDLARATTTSP